MHVSSSPPFRTVRMVFTAHDSTPAVLLHGGNHEVFLRISPASPEYTVDSLRVRLVPLLQSFCRLGAFALGGLPVYTAFPCSDSSAPSDSPLSPRAFVKRFPLTTSPLHFPSTEDSPVFTMEDSHKMVSARPGWEYLVPGSPPAQNTAGRQTLAVASFQGLSGRHRTRTWPSDTHRPMLKGFAMLGENTVQRTIHAVGRHIAQAKRDHTGQAGATRGNQLPEAEVADQHNTPLLNVCSPLSGP